MKRVLKPGTFTESMRLAAMALRDAHVYASQQLTRWCRPEQLQAQLKAEGFPQLSKSAMQRALRSLVHQRLAATRLQAAPLCPDGEHCWCPRIRAPRWLEQYAITPLGLQWLKRRAEKAA